MTTPGDPNDEDFMARERLLFAIELEEARIRGKKCHFGTCPESGCLMGTRVGCCGPTGDPGILTAPT